MEENRTKSYNRKQKSGNPNYRKFVDPEVRKFEGELRSLMTEEENGRNHGKTETRKNGSKLRWNYGSRNPRNRGVISEYK